MSVYFARRTDGTGPIKIGVANYPPARLMDVGFQRRETLEVIASCFGSISLEFRFHALFEPAHLGGEWFDPTPELIEVVAQINDGTFDFGRLPQRGWCITKPFQTKASIAFHGPLPGKRPFDPDTHYRRTRPNWRADPMRVAA